MQLRTDYEINLPKLNGHGVKTLTVDPRYEPCYPEVYTLTQDRMNELLDQIAVYLLDRLRLRLDNES